jgi:RiboL-PSP-HEPN
MAGKSKPSPLAAFEANMADAHQLVRIAECLTNERVRRMRAEPRERIGAALGVGKRKRDQLDWLINQDVWLIFRPESTVRRADFDDQRPLLRQSLVAACAATETYLADKVMEQIGPLLYNGTATPRLRKLTLDLGCWLEINQKYERKRWGLRSLIVEPYVRDQAGTAPNKVGEMLSLIGIEKPLKKLDQQRKVKGGETEALLKRITERRNRIAHTGDRQGRGRANLTIDEVNPDLAAHESVVHAIERLLEPTSPPASVATEAGDPPR